jgi:DNA-binding transcriptional ArsR family regulator
MKREMDLVRELLLAMEKEEPWDLRIDGYSEEQVYYHLYLMRQAGLIDAAVIMDRSSIAEAVPIRMTWDGHEFLDNARSPDTWSKVRGVMKSLGGFGFDVLRASLTSIAVEAAQKRLV